MDPVIMFKQNLWEQFNEYASIAERQGLTFQAGVWRDAARIARDTPVFSHREEASTHELPQTHD